MRATRVRLSVRVKRASPTSSPCATVSAVTSRKVRLSKARPISSRLVSSSGGVSAGLVTRSGASTSPARASSRAGASGRRIATRRIRSRGIAEMLRSSQSPASPSMGRRPSASQAWFSPTRRMKAASGALPWVRTRRRPMMSSAMGAPCALRTRTRAAVEPGCVGSFTPRRSSNSGFAVRGSVRRSSVRPVSSSRTRSGRAG